MFYLFVCVVSCYGEATVFNSYFLSFFFFCNDTATTEIYTLSLHDALPLHPQGHPAGHHELPEAHVLQIERVDRKSTRLNSSHVAMSYAVFCLKKKTKNEDIFWIISLNKMIIIKTANLTEL